MSLESGSPGEDVFLTGSHLDRATGATYGGMPLDPGGFAVESPDRARVRIPLRATDPARIVLAYPGGTLESPVFSPVFLPPTLTGASPALAAAGEEVILTGTHLASVTAVTFGSGLPAAAFRPLSHDTLAVQVPTAAGSGGITVTTRGGTATAGSVAVPLVRVRPVITGIEPALASAGDEVTITGTGLSFVRTVAIAGQLTRVVSTLGRTSVKLRVPAGASAGHSEPVRIWAEDGECLSPMPFTLGAYRVPEITGMAPAAAPPGSQVVLEGRNLLSVVGVSYADVPLRTSQWVVETPLGGVPRIRAWLPQTEAAGTFTLAYPGGEVHSPSFTPKLPVSRVDLLGEALVPFPGLAQLCYPAVDYRDYFNERCLTNGRRPLAPLFHSYDEDHLRPGKDNFKVFLSFHLPPLFQQVLPPALRAELAGLAIPAATPLEMRVVAQDQPFAEPMLFRPHYWLYSDRPWHDLNDGTQQRTAIMGLFDPYPVGASPVHFQGETPGSLLRGSSTVTSVHPVPPELVTPWVDGPAFSPNNLQVEGLDPAQTRAFWSLVQDDLDPLTPGRAVATLHLLLNDGDADALQAIAIRLNKEGGPVPTFRDLAQAMVDDPRLSVSPALEALADLVRPRILGIVHHGAPGGPTFILEGNGFTGASAVTVDGTIAASLHPLGDTRLQVDLPAPLGPGSHTFRVTTLTPVLFHEHTIVIP